MQAGADQNPDPAGNPTPVAIRIYQLASPVAFDRADIFALIDRQAETLGADCLASDEVIVAPGEQRTITHELKPGTRFIGAIALFRAIDQARWRVDALAAPHGPTPLTLVTHDTQLTISTK
jgi:type VI secretion system protein VasD